MKRRASCPPRVEFNKMPDRYYDDLLVSFFVKDQPNTGVPDGCIVKDKCWKCQKERMCFLDKTKYEDSFAPSGNPIPVCMKCRMTGCGIIDGKMCDICIAYGYPCEPSFDRKDAMDTANQRFELHFPNKSLSSDSAMEDLSNFYDQEYDCYLNDVHHWQKSLGLCRYCQRDK